MDTLTYGAATSALFPDAEDARRWFQLISEQLRNLDGDAPVDDAFAAIRQGADAQGMVWAADALLEYVQAEAPEPLTVLRELADPDQESEYVEANWVAATAQGVAQGPAQAVSEDPQEAGQPAAEPSELDEGVWHEYLGRWQGQWDGSEESWGAFKESFLYWAPEGARYATQQLVASAEASDKVAVLAAYGIPSAPPEHGTAEETGDARAEESGGSPAEEIAGPAALEAEAVIASVVQDRPDLAELGSERLQELFAEVMAEFENQEQSATS